MFGKKNVYSKDKQKERGNGKKNNTRKLSKESSPIMD